MTKAEERALEVYPRSEKYTSSQRLIINDMRDGFIQGYEQAEKDIMERAVETVVSLESGGFPVVEFGVGKLGLKVGDKVKLIIVKED